MPDKHFTPDYIQVPYQIIVDEELQPLDRLVYGVIYWIEHLKEGKCTASNKYLSEILHCSVSGVRNALNTLEQRGYIKRNYADAEQTQRKQIKCRIYLKRVSSIEAPPDSIESHNIKVSISKDIDTVTKLDLRELVGYFSREFQRIFNAQPPRVNYGQVGKMLKSVKVPQETLNWMLSEFLKDIAKNDSTIKPAPDLGVFLSVKHFNKYLVKAPNLAKLEADKLKNEKRQNCKICKGTGFVEAGEGRVKECNHNIT